MAHRLDNNNNDIISLPTAPLDLIDTIDSSLQAFELHKQTIASKNIVEIIAIDIDLSGSGKCNSHTRLLSRSFVLTRDCLGSLDETPKVTQLEDDRFNRMEHFYGSDEIDPESLEDFELGDDGKVNTKHSIFTTSHRTLALSIRIRQAGYDPEDMFHTNREKFNTITDFDESKYTYVPLA